MAVAEVLEVRGAFPEIAADRFQCPAVLGERFVDRVRGVASGSCAGEGPVEQHWVAGDQSLGDEHLARGSLAGCRAGVELARDSVQRLCDARELGVEVADDSVSGR